MAGRTPEERRRAAEERAARRRAQARGEQNGSAREKREPQRLSDSVSDPVTPATPATPAQPPEGVEHHEPEPAFEPLQSPTRRTAVAERQPVSRAARAQRIGRPGRPMLPPTAPRPRRWFRRLLALIALLVIGGALYLINATFQPLQSENEQAGAIPVKIPKGADAGGIGELLEAKGVIADARFFELNATLTLRRGKLITGNYVLRRHMTNGAAIEALMQGPKVRVVKTFTVGIAEGQALREAAPAIQESGIDGSYLKAARSSQALARARNLGAPRGTRTLEGFLFPATYELRAGATATDLVDKQLDAFRQNFRSIDLKRAKRRNLTAYDVLIIASLVERETPKASERPLIASVIYNRLKTGEPLGIDATTRYHEKKWSGSLLQSELDDDNAFNTRINSGLPPTPIGNPGLASMKAAAKPAKTDYMFYVAKPGACHAFAETLAEHERNVAAYERAREENGGKAPAQKC